MNLPYSGLVSARKLEITILIGIIILVFKFIFPITENSFILILNEVLIFCALYFGVLYTSHFTQLKKNEPISLIINIGIFNAVLFFLSALSSSLFEVIPSLEVNVNFIYSAISLIIAYIFMAGVVVVLSAFKELYFIRLKTDTHKSYDAMIVFFILAFFAASLPDSNEDPNFIGLTFFVVSIILISINSFRVSWIAFLTKKQKTQLLIISIILGIIFILNAVSTFENSFIKQLLENFSPGLHSLLRLMMIYGSIYCGIIFFTSLFHLPTAEAFDKKVEEASSLKDLSRLITQVFDFNELADSITNLTTKVSNSDSAWLVTKEPGGLKLSSVSNIGYVDADEITKIFESEGILNQEEFVTFSRKQIRLKIKNDIRLFDFKALAISPLKVHNNTSGFLFAARKQNYGFDEDEKKSIEAFADYAAVALENAKLIEESIEKERLKSELKVAREIQYKILPSTTPNCDNLQVSALFIPAYEVGGDYYDFFRMNEDKLGFVIADVSGKGISSAFIMAEVKGVFETLAKLIDSPKELLVKANNILSESLDKKSFVTAVYGFVDKKKGQLSFARAGHMPVYICRNQKIEKLVPNGIGLGLDYGYSFEQNLKEQTVDLVDNDIIVLYTDGITEAKNIKMEEFGYNRFESIISSENFENVEELKSKIINKISSFTQGNSQHDDITLVLMKWVSNNKPSGVN
ncbi:MAG: SpoIIE family protein phosphatase [Bacteroidetes bacterium]|nr:SpoIIE family protein phosphatase [Bacteroidota bacterium]